MNPESKSFRPLMKKLDDSGEFVAVFASFDVIDAHGDVIRPGALREGQEVLVGAWQHDMAKLPVGKGVLRSDAREARIEGSFFLDTSHGRDTYLTVKNAGALLEWSFIFTVVRSSEGNFEQDGKRHYVRFIEDVDTWSVDPVLKGAGINTRTVAVKERARPVGINQEFAKFHRAIARTNGLLN